MTRIVTTHYRYKRPPRKQAAPLEMPAVVTKASKRSRVSVRTDTSDAAKTAPAAPANDDRKPAIVTPTSRKRLKLLRDVRAVERDDDPEGAAQMRAWLERAKWGYGPAR